MNFIKKNFILKITIKNDKNDLLNLYYDLINIDIVDRWIEIINKNIKSNHEIFFNHRKIFNEEELNNIFNMLEINIKNINEIYDRKLKTISSFNDLIDNQNSLNDLHEEFEFFGYRFDNIDKEENKEILKNEFLKEQFLKLNNSIHNLESIIRSKNKDCNCLIDFYPQKIFEELKIEDYFLFTPQMKWGNIYLGYNTLGKNWLNSFFDNDMDVIKRKKIASQKRFAAECFINFSNPNINENISTIINYQFYNWWKKNNVSEYYPELSLRDYAFGYIHIGSVRTYNINDEAIKHISMDEDKEIWNKNVWSKFDKVIDLRVLDLNGFNAKLSR